MLPPSTRFPLLWTLPPRAQVEQAGDAKRIPPKLAFLPGAKALIFYK